MPTAYVASQPPPIVPQTYYPGAYHAIVDYHAKINDTSLTYLPLSSTIPRTLQAEPKAIVELFEQYGRMSASLGQEISDPTTNPARSNGIGFAYIDPPVEVFQRGQIQLWKITHNGVDSHPVNLHLNNAQIINRVRLGRGDQPSRALREGLKGDGGDHFSWGSLEGDGAG